LKVVVDTNIVFSALLNIDSRIARVLLYDEMELQFFSCDFLKFEIAKHKQKILKLTNYSESQFSEIEFLVTKNIHFQNHNLINPKMLAKAEDMLRTVDIDDAPFLALAQSLKAKLWTGDKKLSNGLIKQGYSNCISTDEIAGVIF
jgi:predicted nucleic acid-binding protein